MKLTIRFHLCAYTDQQLIGLLSSLLALVADYPDASADTELALAQIERVRREIARRTLSRANPSKAINPGGAKFKIRRSA